MTEQDWLNMLLGSPLFETVNKIEDMVKNGTGDAGIAGAMGGRPYIDIKVRICGSVSCHSCKWFNRNSIILKKHLDYSGLPDIRYIPKILPSLK